MRKFLLSLLCATSFAYAEDVSFEAKKTVMCTSDFNALQKAIAMSKYKEVVHWGGMGDETKSFFVMYVNKETQTWTFIETNGKEACILAAGVKSLDIDAENIPR